MDAAASFAAWIAALNHPRDRALLEAAVAPTVCVERHGAIERGHDPGPPVEVFEGVERVAAWLARLEKPTTFWSARAPVAAEDGAWTLEYRLRVDDFVNGGLWLARFADDDRLAWLSHRPFPVPPLWR